MKPKMHSMSFALALSMNSLYFSSYFKILKIPFWIYVGAVTIYEFGK